MRAKFERKPPIEREATRRLAHMPQGDCFMLTADERRAAGADRAASKKVFLQLAVRAVRRVHLDSQLMSLGQTDSGKDDSIRQVNQGSGVEAAPESAVRDVLAQEFNASKLGHGWKLRAEMTHQDTEGHYFGVIDREVPYLVTGDEIVEHVDLQYRRVPGPGQNPQLYPAGPVELKRARLYRANLETGVPERRRLQTKEIQRDLRKLVRLVRADRAGTLRRPFGSTTHTDPDEDLVHPQLLVWGDSSDAPEAFMEKVFDGVRDCGCEPLGEIAYESIPAKWKGGLFPPIDAWIWIAIASLKTGPACKLPACRCHASRTRQMASGELADSLAIEESAED